MSQQAALINNGPGKIWYIFNETCQESISGQTPKGPIWPVSPGSKHVPAKVLTWNDSKASPQLLIFNSPSFSPVYQISGIQTGDNMAFDQTTRQLVDNHTGGVIPCGSSCSSNWCPPKRTWIKVAAVVLAILGTLTLVAILWAA